MQVRLHHLLLSLETSSPRIQDEWSQHFSPFLLSPDEEEAKREPDFTLDFSLQPSLSPPPAGHPAYRQPDLAVYETGDRFVIWQPQLGRLSVDPRTRCVTGEISTAALDLYGAFEDLNAVALAPLLRRRGWVLAHAFAAARDGRGLLLVGDNGSGKTTTGLALLADGWKLLSNDAALLGRCGESGGSRCFSRPLECPPGGVTTCPLAEFPRRGVGRGPAGVEVVRAGRVTLCRRVGNSGAGSGDLLALTRSQGQPNTRWTCCRRREPTAVCCRIASTAGTARCWISRWIFGWTWSSRPRSIPSIWGRTCLPCPRCYRNWYNRRSGEPGAGISG